MELTVTREGVRTGAVLGDGNNAVYMQSTTSGFMQSSRHSVTAILVVVLVAYVELKRCTVCMDAGVVGRQGHLRRGGPEGLNIRLGDGAGDGGVVLHDAMHALLEDTIQDGVARSHRCRRL